VRRCLLASLLALAVAGCAHDVERGPVEARNLAALNTIAIPPGAVVVRTETRGFHAPDTSEGPIVGWATVRELRLTRELRAEQVVARARRELRRAGWRIGVGSNFYFNADRKGSCLYLLSLADAPSESEEIPEFITADEAPPEDELPPGQVIVHGLHLKVSDC
jgi:hypothetical protein